MNAPFEIDAHNGTLRFAGLQLVLEAKQSLEQFLATEAATRAENGGGNDGWQRYHFRRQSLGDGRMLGVSLYFFHGSLSKVNFGYLPKGEDDWSTWSKERELARADTYRQELSQQLGRLGRFPWGFVGAVYDDKSAGARLFVRYEPSGS